MLFLSGKLEYWNHDAVGEMKSKNLFQMGVGKGYMNSGRNICFSPDAKAI
jgi:hypothetical protein